MEAMAKKHSSFVSLIPIGKTFEKRSMKVLKINTKDGGPNKKRIWVDAGRIFSLNHKLSIIVFDHQ
jgi:hypothetical protein